jgi:ethanolamine utilization protein EutQ (cupin superfamily)
MILETIIKEKFNTPNDFSLYIEKRANLECSTCLDTIVSYCSEVDIDVESVKKMINKSLKEKLHKEAIELHYFKQKTGKLNI